MKKILFLFAIATTLLMAACTQCYTCTIPNTDTIVDYCGRGSDLKDLVNTAESVGYTCEKR
jgi:hypothetical protein